MLANNGTQKSYKTTTTNSLKNQMMKDTHQEQQKKSIQLTFFNYILTITTKI